MEWSLEMFSRPQVIGNSRQYICFSEQLFYSKLSRWVPLISLRVLTGKNWSVLKHSTNYRRPSAAMSLPYEW